MNRQKEYNQCKKPIMCDECKSNSFCKEWEAFVLLHNKEKSYAHFDKRVSLAMPSVRKYAMDNQKVATHSFYPFIHFTKTISRFGKKEPKVRKLYYCSHLDRCVYQRYAFLLNQKYNEHVKDTAIDRVAIAYRNNLDKNNIDFAKDAFDAIKRYKHSLVVVGDFTEFFDRINHAYLKKMLCRLLDTDRLPEDYFAVFKNITRFASWNWKLLVEQSGNSITERGIRTKLNKQNTILTRYQFLQHKKSILKNKKPYGIPQGSPISAILSNIYMMSFDEELNSYVEKNNGVFMRYSDDFLIVLPYESKEKINKHKEFIFSQVKDIPDLDLQKNKTFIYIFNDGLITNFPENKPAQIDYLGFLFDGSDIKIRPRAITKYYYRMQRKARNIGRNNWKSPNGKHISAKNLYTIYSGNGTQQTFIDYAKRAKSILKLNDMEANALIKHHKRKIALAIKNGEQQKNR